MNSSKIHLIINNERKATFLPFKDISKNHINNNDNDISLKIYNMENNKKQMFKTVNGVTYFKLRSDFEGDYTKNCGLLGEEIDENFYFLRGYDIADIYMDRDKNLIIERVDNDYPSFKVNLGEICEKDKFYLFNAEYVMLGFLC